MKSRYIAFIKVYDDEHKKFYEKEFHFTNFDDLTRFIMKQTYKGVSVRWETVLGVPVPYKII